LTWKTFKAFKSNKVVISLFKFNYKSQTSH
jgi:hypothetical protein